MSRYMSKQNLKYFASGIYYSKLNYCLPVFGNVFGLDEYKEENSRYQTFTVNDNYTLQVLQNKMNRLLTQAEYNTPTVKLLDDTDSLSILQMIANQSAILAYKIIKSGKPQYLAQKLQQKKEGMVLRGNLGSIRQTNKKRSITKEGFVYRSVALMNKLDDNLRNEGDLGCFKTGMKKWVKENISVKPSSKHPQLNLLRPARIQQQPVANNQNLNDIRRYFVPS